MLVLPLPHHSALRYSICYSSLNDSHDHPLFSTCLCSPSPLLLLSLPLSSTLPPGHSLYFSCTHCHRCSPAIVLALCRSFAFAAPLLLQPKHKHTTHIADPPRLTSANGTVNTHTLALDDSFESPLSHFLLRTADPRQHTKLLPAECHFMTGGMVAPTALSATRTHKNLHTHTCTHTCAQRHTLKHAATQPLSNKSAALLHPVRLNPVNVLQTCCPVLSCVVPLAKFSTVQHQESCLAGMKSCPEKSISGLHHLAPPSLPPLSLLLSFTFTLFLLFLTFVLQI